MQNTEQITPEQVFEILRKYDDNNYGTRRRRTYYEASKYGQLIMKSFLKNY